ncbi:MAG: Hsp20/alpha crystallin family protein [Ignavibacteria bacterium]|nr:Hsp20/alpha crystallin family protein [Ignavibacteria bacterium]
MGIIKVDPFRGFDNMLRRVGEVFDDVNRGGVRFEIGDFSPRVDIADTDTSITFHAELPGLVKSDVKIAITDGNVLTIRGEKKREEKTEEKNFLRVERSWGSFTRSFALPDNLDTSKVDASFENGVLNVSIPKAEPSKPKEQEISIK